MSLSLILPNIRSCHNVGAMFRTADACGFSKLYLTGYTATPPKPQIDKVSLGAETWVAWEYREDVVALIAELKDAGNRIVALEQTETSIDIAAYSPVDPLVLVVGNEVDGLSSDIVALCDDCIHIPMVGRKESLNVSVAAGIAMYEIKKQVVKNKKQKTSNK